MVSFKRYFKNIFPTKITLCVLSLTLTSCILDLGQKSKVKAPNAQQKSAGLDGTISINNNQFGTATPEVFLSLFSATATEMYITNTANCDGGGEWEAYKTTRKWILESSGSIPVKVVYVKYKDVFGNVGICQSDQIHYDGNEPTIESLVVNYGNSSTNSNVVDVELETSPDIYKMAISNRSTCSKYPHYVSLVKKFNWALDDSVENGTLYVSFKFLNTSGKETECRTFELIHDNIEPSFTVDLPANNTIIDGSTNSLFYAISGTCEESSKWLPINIKVMDSSGFITLGTGLGVCSDDGTWSGSIDTVSLADDLTYKVLSEFADQAGNTTSKTIELIKNATTSVDVTSPLTGEYINIANVNSFRVQGTCEATESALTSLTVNLTIDSETTTVACSSGVWEKTGWDLSSLSDGSYTLVATITDSVGNTQQQNVSILKDTVAPVAVSFDITTSHTNLTLPEDFSVTLSATGATLMRIENNTVCSGTSPLTSYSTSKSVNVISTNTTSYFSVRYYDAAGNSSSCLSDSIIHDDIDPVANITSITNGYIFNLSDSISTYIINGTCGTNDAGLEIDLSLINTGLVPPSAVTTATATCNSGGTWTTNLDLTVPAHGDNLQIDASLTDLAGNFGTTSVTGLSKDTQPLDLTFSGTLTTSPYINSANETSFVIDGTCDALLDTKVINITIDSVSTTATCTSGNWAATGIDTSSAGENISDGIYTLTATVPLPDGDDGVGNFPYIELSITKDTVAPSLTASKLDNQAPYNSIGGISGDNYQSYIISGDCDETGGNVNVEFSENSTLVNGSAPCLGGTYQAITDLSLLNPTSQSGTVDVTVTQTDPAGNTGTNISLQDIDRILSNQIVFPSTLTPLVVEVTGSDIYASMFTALPLSSNVQNYRVKACTEATCDTNCIPNPYHEMSNATGSRTVPDITLSVDTPYFLCGQTIDIVGNISVWYSSTGRVKYLSAPEDPINVLAASTDDSVTIYWNSGGGTTADYRLAYNIGTTYPTNCDSGTTNIPESSINEFAVDGNLSYTINGLGLGQTIYFALCAVNDIPSPGTKLTSNSVLGSITTRRAHYLNQYKDGGANDVFYNIDKLSNVIFREDGSKIICGGTTSEIENYSLFDDTLNIVVAKFDVDDELVWAYQTGHDNDPQYNNGRNSFATDCYEDDISGAIYVVGVTQEVLEFFSYPYFPDKSRNGNGYDISGHIGTMTYDTVVIKLNSSGVEQWINQLQGEAQSIFDEEEFYDFSRSDEGMKIFFDRSQGEVLVLGHSDNNWCNGGFDYDVFIARLEGNDGSLNYLSRMNDDCMGYVPDLNNSSGQEVITDAVYDSANRIIYATGMTSGSLFEANNGGYDIFMLEFDIDSNDIIEPISVSTLVPDSTGAGDNDYAGNLEIYDDDNLILSGSTDGDFGGTNGGGEDCFVTKINISTLDIVSIKQFGNNSADAVGTDQVDVCGGFDIVNSLPMRKGSLKANNGDIYFSGMTSGFFQAPTSAQPTFPAIGGVSGANQNDRAFVAKLNSSLELQWSYHFNNTFAKLIYPTNYINTNNVPIDFHIYIQSRDMQHQGVLDNGVLYFVSSIDAGLAHGRSLANDADYSFGTLSSFGEFYPRKPIIVAGDAHTCVAIGSDGVKCWGENALGELGLGDTNNRGDDEAVDAFHPATDLGLNRYAVQLAAGGTHTCAILDNGDTKCWGGNASGQLGDGTILPLGDGASEMGDNLVPLDFGVGRSAIKVTAGALHTCVLLDNLEVRCWGENSNGQLGVNSTTDQTDASMATAVNLGSSVVDVQAGDEFNCALLINNTVKCWGDNTYGQLGQDVSTTPMGDSVNPIENIAALNFGAGALVEEIYVGGTSTCALLRGTDNNIVCWGDNTYGQLGINDNSGDNLYISDGTPGNEMSNLAYVVPDSLRLVDRMVGGGNFFCSYHEDKDVRCWGGNNTGQLGQELSTAQNIGDEAGEMFSLDDILYYSNTISAIAAGKEHVCAINEDQTVKCWGSRGSGRLGDNCSPNCADNTGDDDTADEMSYLVPISFN